MKTKTRTKTGKRKTIGKFGSEDTWKPGMPYTVSQEDLRFMREHPPVKFTGTTTLTQEEIAKRKLSGLADPTKYPTRQFPYNGTKDPSKDQKFEIRPIIETHSISRGLGGIVSDIARNRTDGGGIGSTVREMAKSQNRRGLVVDDIIGGSGQKPQKYEMAGFVERAQKVGEPATQPTYMKRPVIPEGFKVTPENAPKVLGGFGKKKSKKSRRK